MATDWNKHGAIAGYGAWAFAAASIGGVLWLGLRQPSTLQKALVSAPLVPSWAFWVAPSIYGCFLLVAALLHFKARTSARLGLPPAIHDRVSNPEILRLEQCLAAETGLSQRLSTELSTIQQSLSQVQEKHAKEHITLAGVWDLKTKARDIRRRWPSSYFERRPLDKEYWNKPAFGGSASRNWPPPYVDPALAWFELFSRAQLGLPMDWTWLKSLDFDGVMESLDILERQARGLLASQLPTGTMRPMIDVRRYGTAPEGSIGEGLYLVNLWDGPALELQIDDTCFNAPSLSFKGPTRLAKDDPDCFFRIEMTERYGSGSLDGLFKKLRDWQECSDDWKFRLPVSIVYRDLHDNWYRSVCELEPDSTIPKPNVKVTLVGQRVIEKRH